MLYLFLVVRLYYVQYKYGQLHRVLRGDVGSTLSPVPSCRTVWWVEFEGGGGGGGHARRACRVRGHGGVEGGGDVASSLSSILLTRS